MSDLPIGLFVDLSAMSPAKLAESIKMLFLIVDSVGSKEPLFFPCVGAIFGVKWVRLREKQTECWE